MLLFRRKTASAQSVPACVGAEFATVYVFSLFEKPPANFVAVVRTQQQALETRVKTRGSAETKLVEAFEEAQQAARSKATFLANTSHELAKAIVELHRGKLLLRSAPGRGTEAIILLPSDRVLSSAPAE